MGSEPLAVSVPLLPLQLSCGCWVDPWQRGLQWNLCHRVTSPIGLHPPAVGHVVTDQ